MKTCSKCKQLKQETEFYANKRMKDGLNTFCISCHKADNIARKAVNRADEAFRLKEADAKQEYRERNAEKVAASLKMWRTARASHVSQYSKKYRAENKEHYNFLCQRRKIALLNRTPKWLTDDDMWVMEEAYILAALRSKVTGVSHHVDHEIPLRGKKVSGLHVPTNLRVIPALENMQKTNKFEV